MRVSVGPLLLIGLYNAKRTKHFGEGKQKIGLEENLGKEVRLRQLKVN